MKYTDWLIPELRDLEAKRQFLSSAPDRIRELRQRSTAIRSARADATPARGGATPYEEAMINNMAARQKLEANIRIVSRDVKWLEDGLEKLSESERLVLDRFYVHRVSGHVDRLMKELNMEQAQVYRLKDQALIHLARVLFGVVEL